MVEASADEVTPNLTEAQTVKVPKAPKTGDSNGTTPLWRNEHGITFMGLYNFFLNDNSLNM